LKTDYQNLHLSDQLESFGVEGKRFGEKEKGQNGGSELNPLMRRIIQSGCRPRNGACRSSTRSPDDHRIKSLWKDRSNSLIVNLERSMGGPRDCHLTSSFLLFSSLGSAGGILFRIPGITSSTMMAGGLFPISAYSL